MKISFIFITILVSFLLITPGSYCLAGSGEPGDGQGCDIQAAQQALNAVCNSCPANYVSGYVFETKPMGSCDPSARTLLNDEQNGICQQESLDALPEGCPDEVINDFDCCATKVEGRNKFNSAN